MESDTALKAAGAAAAALALWLAFDPEAVQFFTQHLDVISRAVIVAISVFTGLVVVGAAMMVHEEVDRRGATGHVLEFAAMFIAALYIVLAVRFAVSNSLLHAAAASAAAIFSALAIAWHVRRRRAGYR
jgi:Protein of unknown function (DUF3681).